MVFATSKGSDQPCAYMQTDHRICLLLEYSMTVKLLTEHHLEFLCLTGCGTGLSESTLVKMPHCWKSRVAAHISFSLRQGTTVVCHRAQTAQSSHDGCSSIGHLIINKYYPLNRQVHYFVHSSTTTNRPCTLFSSLTHINFY